MADGGVEAEVAHVGALAEASPSRGELLDEHSKVPRRSPGSLPNPTSLSRSMSLGMGAGLGAESLLRGVAKSMPRVPGEVRAAQDAASHASNPESSRGGNVLFKGNSNAFFQW